MAVVEVSNLVEVIPPPVGELAVGIAAGAARRSARGVACAGGQTTTQPRMIEASSSLHEELLRQARQWVCQCPCVQSMCHRAVDTRNLRGTEVWFVAVAERTQR